MSQYTQNKPGGLALLHNFPGLQELLTFTEQSSASGAFLRIAGPESGCSPQCFPPWDAPADAHESGHSQAPCLRVKSHLSRVKGTQRETPGKADFALCLQTNIFLLVAFRHLTFHL